MRFAKSVGFLTFKASNVMYKTGCILIFMQGARVFGTPHMHYDNMNGNQLLCFILLLNLFIKNSVTLMIPKHSTPHGHMRVVLAT